MSRRLWLVAGLVFLVVGIAGFVLPLVPGTGPLIVALYCFRRSSSKLEKWLLSHRAFGPMLADWDRYRAIKPKTKVMIVALLWLCLGLSVWILPNWYVAVMLFVVGAGVTAYVLSRPSMTDDFRMRVDAEAAPYGTDT